MNTGSDSMPVLLNAKWNAWVYIYACPFKLIDVIEGWRGSG